MSDGFGEKKRSLLERLIALFPERQLLLRANGQVKFIRFPPHLQITVLLIILGIFIWSGYTSLSTLTSSTVISKKNQEINGMHSKFQALREDYQQLDLTLDERVERLERLQQYFQQMLDTDPLVIIDDASSSDDGQLSNDTDQTQSSLMPRALDYANFDAIARGHEEVHWPADIIARRLSERLDKIEQAQHLAAEKMTRQADTQSQTLKAVLAQTKLPLDRLMALAQEQGSPAPEQAGIGGPFVASPPILELVGSDHPLIKARDAHEHLAMVKNILNAMPSLIPPEDYYISSPYGSRIDPYRKRRAFHPGIDMAGWPGTKIMAAAPGVVVAAKFNGAYGRMVEIDHGYGIRTRYGHMRRLTVKKGERVARGQLIGEMGSTGRSTSTHLHYEIWFDGKTVNPYPFLQAADDVLQIQRQQGG